VTQIQLSGSSIVGTLPSSLSHLTALTSLVLNYNSFSGTLPTALGGLTNLATLGLGRNSLVGSIPSQLGSLSSLNVLLLSSNSLTGTVPSGLCSLNLYQVTIGNNANLCYLSCLSAVYSFDGSSSFECTPGNLFLYCISFPYFRPINDCLLLLFL